MKKNTLGIITINYNHLDDTLELLESLSKAVVPRDLIVNTYIVDNNSIDKPNAVIEKLYPQFHIINSNQNLGFSGGNNLGIRRALLDNCEILVLINNDCIVEKNFYKNILSSPALTDHKIGIFSGLIFFAPGFEFAKTYSKSELGKVIWYAGGFFDYQNVLGSNRFVDQVDNGKLNFSETDFASGALLITRREVLNKIGLLDENYFMYLEDVDLCHRAKMAGYQVYFDPKIKIWHKSARSSAIGSSLNDYFTTRNRLLFGAKFLKFRTKFALFREACRKLLAGTPAQKQAIKDYYLNRLGKGTFIK